MDKQHQAIVDILSRLYEEAVIDKNAFWAEVSESLNIPEESTIKCLYTSQQFMLEVIKFLLKLPYKENSSRILSIASTFLDPSPCFIKNIIQQLVSFLETDTPCLSTLNVCLAALKSLFEQQTPVNENINSHIYLYGPEEGIKLEESMKWPFEIGGTLAFWYNMAERTKECKIFEFLNEEKVGFEIVMKNKKIYIQKQEGEAKFRFIKNTSAFLCEALFDRDVKLCIQFDLKKKFFQPYFSINVIMNNFVVNGVEMDSFAINSNSFKISLFKHFYGKFYSSLFLGEKMAALVEELNNQRGFIYENDIRNFTYFFEDQYKKSLGLFSSIRAETTYLEQNKNEKQLIFNELNEEVMSWAVPESTILYDAINKSSAKIGEKAACYYNASIKKDIGNYGGFQTFIPFLDLLEVCCLEEQSYSTAVNQYLQLIRVLFLNKTNSIEQAFQLNFFKMLATFFNKTRMIGFTYRAISKLKEMYIALNTRMLRQRYVQDLVWGINFCRLLTGDNFTNYIKFVKTFYNQDIQTNLNIFGVSKILNVIITEVDTPQCCLEHFKNSNRDRKIKNYKSVLEGIFEVILNILLMKRLDSDLTSLIQEIYWVFSQSISPCFIEGLISFIFNVESKDSEVNKIFVSCLLNEGMQCKLSVYKALSCCTSWKTKGVIIDFLLKKLYSRLFNETCREKEMITLCARYPTMNYIRASSIKSQQNRDSIDYSEDKLSLNSATLHKLIIINPLETQTLLLLEDDQIINVIAEWTFSPEVLKHVSEENENPGLSILMELYKGSTYKLRNTISKLIIDKIGEIRFSPELMAWAMECLLIAEFDLRHAGEEGQQIEETEKNFLQTISAYDVEEEDENNELSIIKLVFSSVKSKYSDDITKVAGNKIFLTICQKKFIKFWTELKEHDISNMQTYNKLCNRIISNIFTFVNEYFILKGDEDENEFEEDMADIAEEQIQIVLTTLQQILQILILATVPTDKKIIDEANAERNHYISTLLFPNREKDKQNLMVLIFACLEGIFQFFDNLNIEWRKRDLIILKKYLMFMIELTENSDGAKQQHNEEEFKQIFLNTLSFLQNKYYQYFYYPFDRHKKVSFQVENKIRKNVEEMRETIFCIFADLIELIKFVEEKGSMEHKSFYELMKPKRKAVHKYSLKNIYPPCWKKADEQIIEFLYLKKQTLKRDAKEKLENHLIQKKVSAYSTEIEKKIAKSIYDYIEEEKKEAEIKQKKSVNFYKIVESEKCRIFSECEEELTLFRMKIADEQKIFFNRYQEESDRREREMNFILKKLWNENRTFSGFWTNPNFYQFCQSEGISYDNTLQKFYRRVRSRRQTEYFLTPFIKIQAVFRKSQFAEFNNKKKTHSNQLFLEGSGSQKTQKPKKGEKLRIGFQFLKNKVVEKLMKSSLKSFVMQIEEQVTERKSIIFQNVLWVKPMKICPGHLKIDSETLSFCHSSSRDHNHLSLLDNSLSENEVLVKQWSLNEIEGLEIKRFLLKPNAIEIYFKTRKTLFLSFYQNSAAEFKTFVDELTNFWRLKCSKSNNGVLKNSNLIRDWSKLEITEKWRNYEISNFDYLMCLNIASGRTNSDLNQYPVFPWVFSQYFETKFKKNESKYRDFSKNMGQIGSEQRISKFKDNYENIKQHHEEDFPVPHNFGFHYSNLGIILQYLVRVNPYSQGAQNLQGGKFDIPDRLFSSIPESYKNVTSQISDLRELIPEFFYFPEFLINCEGFDFGELQVDKKKVNNVELPDGCLNAFDFIEAHRQALETPEVSLSIHKWIDLIFGYKNSGREAEKAMNTYHYLTDQNNLSLIEDIQDDQKKEAVESQMVYYGKTPSQIFSKPHLQRLERKQAKFEDWLELTLPLPSDQESKPSQIVLFDYSEIRGEFIIVFRNGKGFTFKIQNKEIIQQNVFQINFDKHEGIKIMNEKARSQAPFASVQCEKIVVGGLWGGKILVFDILHRSYDILMKHTDLVSCFCFSEKFQLLISGSKNGQICKWSYFQNKIVFSQRMFLYSSVNFMEVNCDLKALIVCCSDGSVGIVSLEKMEIIRIIKLPGPAIHAVVVKFPYYLLYIECESSRQYCYTINGTKLEQNEMETRGSRPWLFCSSVTKEKVAVRIGHQILLLKMPEFTVQQRIESAKSSEQFSFIVNSYCIASICASQIKILVFQNTQKQEKGTESDYGVNAIKLNSLFL